jgi:LDH2 family malate/lactate/ureidoglycolate dehydrogenase
MTLALKKQGHTDENIPFIINMYLGGELRGHTSHGLSSFAAFAKEQVTDTTAPEVVKDTHALFVIDAKSNSGNIVGKRAADEAIKRAKQEGIGIAIVKSMDSWLRPGAVAEYIGDQGFVAIVMNNGRGVAVAPPGGYDPVAGTNPIAYAIPTNDGTLVVTPTARPATRRRAASRRRS